MRRGQLESGLICVLGIPMVWIDLLPLPLLLDPTPLLLLLLLLQDLIVRGVSSVLPLLMTSLISLLRDD